MTRAAYIEPTSRRQAPSTLYGAIAAACWAIADQEGQVSWPSNRWQHDPVGFFHEVLGVKDLSDDQIEFIEAVRDNRNTSATSGHKTGKTRVLAGLALWFWACFPAAVVILTAVKEEQINNVVWKDLKVLHRQAARGPYPLGGELRESARGGLRAVDADGTERTVRGMVARDKEGAAGISGFNVFLGFDEASGIADEFFEALGTSMFGDGGTVRKVYASQPTRTTGEFFKSQTTKKDIFRCLTLSSLNTPNVRGTGKIPGLAGPDLIAEKRIEWGEDSPLWKVRILGEFVLNEEGKLFSVAAITEAEDAWTETAFVGRLHIGIDPAGPGEGGDESGFAIRRTKKLLKVYGRRGLTASGILTELLGIIREHRLEREQPPVVCLDREGPIGSEVMGLLRAHLQKPGHEHDFELVVVRASDKAVRRPDLYDRVRDELWASGAEWVKDGGALPPDAKLSGELSLPAWYTHTNGKLKVTPKSDMRKSLERSPDRADAFLLSVWSGTVADVRERAQAAAAERDTSEPEHEGAYSRTGINPYAMSYGGRR